MLPAFRLWNKSFKDSSFTREFAERLVAFLSSLGSNINSPNSEISAFAFDDLFVWFRNLGFLRDPIFSRAVSDYCLDPVVMTKIWRIWILASTLASASKMDGDIVDIGTYDGKSILIALRYALEKSGNVITDGYSALIYDAFENPPEEARKINHGRELFDSVCKLFEPFPFVIPIKGYIPASCIATHSKVIKWAQIDLNSADADSKAFLYVLPRLCKGSIVIFDDYGFARYRNTQEALNLLVSANKLNPIIELPTGQGLYIHH